MTSSRRPLALSIRAYGCVARLLPGASVYDFFSCVVVSWFYCYCLPSSLFLPWVPRTKLHLRFTCRGNKGRVRCVYGALWCIWPWSHCAKVRKLRKKRKLVLSSLSPIYLVLNSRPEGVSPPFRMGLSSSVISFWRYSNRHAQRYVSMVILDSVKLTLRLNTTACFPLQFLSGWYILFFLSKKAHSHPFKA